MIAPPSFLPDAVVKLKPGREKSILSGHPWIFSGAIASKPDVEPGAFVAVHSAGGKFLGSGILNQRCSLSLRMIGTRREPPSEILTRNMRDALDLRRACFSSNTNCMRMINAEGDAMPGLIVDRYDRVLVLQIGCLGMDLIKPWLIDQLRRSLQPLCIKEKSSGSSRKEEGLQNYSAVVWGEDLGEAEVLENGIRYIVDLNEGQKTGFFLDQREMRAFVRGLAHGKTVLNCFSYSAGFSVAAAIGGAKHVVSVDSSNSAIAFARRNFELNSIEAGHNDFIEADVFDYLAAKHGQFDMVILDPPAFAKGKTHLQRALRGYAALNALGMNSVKRGGILLTFSCSYYVDEVAFRGAVARASRQTGKGVCVIASHRQALDHPVNLHHPEGSYLKGLACHIL